MSSGSRSIWLTVILFLLLIVYVIFTGLKNESSLLQLHLSTYFEVQAIVDDGIKKPQIAKNLSEVVLDRQPLVLAIDDSDSLTALQSTVHKAINSLWQNWEINDFPIFLELLNVPEKSWNIQVHKFTKLLLESTSRRKLVVGFSGSSITAGHGTRTLITLSGY